MNKEELLEFLKENLSAQVSVIQEPHSDYQRLHVTLYLGDEEISDDYEMVKDVL